MSRAARMLIGRHNFICFRAPDPSRPDESTIVVIDDASIEEDGDLILFRITGSHFLWRMVRRVVGVLAKIGKGEVSLDEFTQLLDGKSNPRLDVAAATAPASGLFLERVDYPLSPTPSTGNHPRQTTHGNPPAPNHPRQTTHANEPAREPTANRANQPRANQPGRKPANPRQPTRANQPARKVAPRVSKGTQPRP